MTADPGLNLTRLHALHRPHPAAPGLTQRISDHLAAHDGYLAFSGGKDSLAVLHLTLQVEPNVPVAFFDSGFEFPETYRYIAELTDRWHLQLHVITAQHTTLELLIASGAWDHTAPRQPTPDLHQVLISEPASRAHAQHGPGELWGVRAQESRGRAALYANALRAETDRFCHSTCCAGPSHHNVGRRTHGGIIRRTDHTIAYGPVWDWTTQDIWAYTARHQLPVNPVYAKLRRLGAPEHFLRVSHLLDANRLEEGRVSWLRRGWPELFDELASMLPRLREYV